MLIIAAASMAAALSSLIQAGEGTEYPKQIIRPETAIIAVNLSNYCNI